MSEKTNFPREVQDFINAMGYHGQLLDEIQTLFRIYCSMCGEHSKETEPALARAIFFTLFGSIEASCRIFASSILLADSLPHPEVSPVCSLPPVAKLDNAEKQFLRQETEEMSTGTWTPRQRTKFVPLQDALVGYPTIYARIFGSTVTIDKSCSEWQDFLQLKRLRDIGAHGNTNELRSTPELMQVSYLDLKRLLGWRRWYCTQLDGLPGIAETLSKGEISLLDRLLEAGFSEKCRRIREQRYAQQGATPDADKRLR